jgi:hypothetical protein
MRVSIELPDPPRLEPLLESLGKQYHDVMQRLLALQADAQREDRYAPILQAMQAQQDGLVSAFERMMQAMEHGKQQQTQDFQHAMREEVAAPQQEASDALISAIRGVKKTLSALPHDLGDAMNKQFKSRQQTIMKSPAKPAPDRTNRIVQKLDEMESALVQGLKKSRNRTFGSNY